MSQKSHKPRVFTSEFKLKAVQRLLKGESVAAVSADLSVARKDLYAWKRSYRIGGASMLRPRGRPPRSTQISASRDSNVSDLERARQRIEELERKVGKQELELDFFGKALRCVEQAEAMTESRSANLSKRKQRKAN